MVVLPSSSHALSTQPLAQLNQVEGWDVADGHGGMPPRVLTTLYPFTTSLEVMGK